MLDEMSPLSGGICSAFVCLEKKCRFSSGVDLRGFGIFHYVFAHLEVLFKDRCANLTFYCFYSTSLLACSSPEAVQ